MEAVRRAPRTPAERLLADHRDGPAVLELLRAMPGIDGEVAGRAPQAGAAWRSSRRAIRSRAYRAARRVRNRPPGRTGGWVAAPPDFVGIGVQRAGTSWWFSLLESHPGVHPLGSSAAKELHHFDRFELVPPGAADAAAYERHFLRPEGMQCGEWTPRYLYDPWVGPLLAEWLPDTRLLVLLRDPVERFRSGVTHTLDRQGRVVVDDVVDAFARGLYGAQLTRLERSVRREQVLVQAFERCRRDAATELARTVEFLGLPPAPPPPSLREQRNAAGTTRFAFDEGWLREVAAAYAADVEVLRALRPEVPTDGWRDYATG